MTVGSLFAGIGGFDLAAERAGLEVKWQVEIDDYCTKVLEKHWPHVKRYRDVRRVHGFDVASRGLHTLNPCRDCLEPVDIICGGFPCQDVSVAGDGVGLDGERSGLWFEMVRLIRELRPRFVVVENVAGLLDRGLGVVLGNLAESGYDAEWACFPTGRPMGHDRARVFIVAHIVREGLPQWSHPYQVRADAPRIFTRERFASILESVDPRQEWADRPLLGRGIHGIPSRVDRVKSLGNSVVPQVAQCIFERIKDAEAEVTVAKT